jgi:hypothetical protein
MKLNAKQRKYVYGIAGTVIPLLVTVGVLSQEIAGQVLAIVASVLYLGSSTLAIKNVPDED